MASLSLSSGNGRKVDDERGANTHMDPVTKRVKQETELGMQFLERGAV